MLRVEVVHVRKMLSRFACVLAVVGLLPPGTPARQPEVMPGAASAAASLHGHWQSRIVHLPCIPGPACMCELPLRCRCMQPSVQCSTCLSIGPSPLQPLHVHAVCYMMNTARHRVGSYSVYCCITHLRASCITCARQCVGSGADTMPSVCANLSAASKHSFCGTDTASIRPSSYRWLTCTAAVREQQYRGSSPENTQQQHIGSHAPAAIQQQSCRQLALAKCHCIGCRVSGCENGCNQGSRRLLESEGGIVLGAAVFAATCLKQHNSLLNAVQVWWWQHVLIRRAGKGSAD